MSLVYTNGIGPSQQQTGAAETAAVSAANRAAKTAVGEGITGATSDTGKADGAQLSTSASIVAQAFAGSDVRSAKVAALQQTIAAGTYNVSSSDVADKLLSALLR